MSTRPLMLEGRVDVNDSELRHLRQTNAQQAEEIRNLREEILTLRDGLRGVDLVRKELNPLWNAMQQLYGYMDRVPSSGIADNVRLGAGSKWEAVKQKLPPRRRELVDLLMLQGSMSRSQIAAALKSHYNTAKNLIADMKGQGWLVENGGNISLREL